MPLTCIREVRRDLRLLRQEMQTLREEVQAIRQGQEEIVRLIRDVRFRVTRPASISLRVTGEMIVAKVKKIQFVAELPPRPESDSEWNEIASGVLEVVIGEEVITIPTVKEQQLTETREVTDERFLVEQNTTVPVTFQYIDDAGNLGAKAEAIITITDTIPPVVPGAIGLRAVAEVEVDVPDVEPEPEPGTGN